MTRLLARVPMFVAVLLVTSGAYANGGGGRVWDGSHMWGMGDGWGWMILGPIMMIVVIGAIVAVAVLLVRWLGGARQGPQSAQTGPPGNAPLDILKARFARGEIDKNEYEERRTLLSD